MLKLVRSRRLSLTLVLLAMVTLSGTVAVIAAAPTTQPNSGDDLLRYLGWVVEWYGAVNSHDSTAVDPRDLVYQDSVEADSKQRFSRRSPTPRRRRNFSVPVPAAPPSLIPKAHGQSASPRPPRTRQRMPPRSRRSLMPSIGKSTTVQPPPVRTCLPGARRSWLS